MTAIVHRAPPCSTLRRSFSLLMGLAVLLCAVLPASAKRAAPKSVPPVTIGQIEYSAPPEFMGFVIATDKQSQKELWRERIYTVKIDPALERDVQDNFIAALAVERGVLVITDERGAQFSLDPATRKATQRE